MDPSAPAAVRPPWIDDERVPRWIGAGVACFGLVTLAGWFVGLEALLTMGVSRVAIRPLTSIGLACGGTGLWLAARPRPAAGTLRLAGLAAAALGGLGLFSLGRHLVDRTPAAELADARTIMSPMSALSAVLTGLGLWLSLADGGPRRVAPKLLAVLGAVLPVAVVLTAAFGSLLLPGAHDMAAHSAAAFTVFAAGLLLLGGRQGPLGLLLAPTAGGQLLRRVWPAVVCVPVALVWGRLHLERLGLLAPLLGPPLVATGNLFTISLIFWWAAARFHRLDRERLALERSLADSNARLGASNEELEAFAYSVAHDLRAPLRAIEGFSQALQEDHAEALNAEGRGWLGRIRAATVRMSVLIDDLLRLSRITRAQMTRVDVDLSGLAAETCATLAQRSPDRRVTVRIEEGLVASGDPALLRVLLENLLGNAWKFTGRCPEPVIEVGAAERDGRRVVFVRDNGAGFDMAFAGKLFGAFQRLHAASEYEGTGIGLATVRRIVHRHGGRVWAEAAPGRGATFWLALP